MQILRTGTISPLFLESLQKMANDITQPKQQTFPWYNPSEYEPVADPHWPDPTTNPIETISQIMDESPAGVQPFIAHHENIYNPEIISFQDACVNPVNPIIVVTVNKRKFVVDIESERIEPAEEWLSGIYDHGLANYVPCPDHNAEFWDSIQPTPGTFMYHATDPDNIENIKQVGLTASCETRGISNRSMNCAVFTSSSPELISSYGEAIVTIDVGKMKADKYMPTVSKESPFEDEEMRSTLAHKIGIEYDPYQHYESEGLNPETVAFFDNIPVKYLSFD